MGFADAPRVVKFPVVVPTGVPSEWQPNSFSQTASASSVPAAVRGGWLLPDGSFITLIESQGTVQQVLDAEIGSSGVVTGSLQVDGAEWTISPGRREEQAWTKQSAGVTFLITGSADRAAFQALAASVSQS
jgi:hypothetical protein